MIRDSFVFYKSFADAISEMPREYQLRAYEVIISYALTGDLPDESEPWAVRAIFQVCKANIDANNKRYVDGHKGGRPKKPVVSESKTSGFETENQWFQNSKPNDNDNVTDNDNVNANDTDNDTDTDNANDTDNIKTLSDSVRPSQQSAADKINYQYIIDNLNGKTGKHYRVTDKTRSLIRARIRDGFTESDFIKVIDNKVRSWANDPKMSQYLRPETLFGTKFEGYLNETHQAYVSGDLPF